LPTVRDALRQRSPEELAALAEKISHLKTVAEVEEALEDFLRLT